MPSRIRRFYDHLGEPLVSHSRGFLAVLAVPILLAFTGPLWTMDLHAPQYPQGLTLEIYAHTVGGDVREVNTLNHYIGMQPIDRTALSDLDWIPFALGALALLSLRVAALGDLRSLLDLVTLFFYFSTFSMARFVYKLWFVGHHLDPHAPFDVEPFTPAILGTKVIANFTATSLPGTGALWVALYGTGLLVALAWNLRALGREAPAGP